MAYLPREVNAAMRPAGLLWGRLLASNPAWPLHFSALLGDLRPRFLDKGRVGRSHRAIARNGRVLLVSELPLEALANNVVRIRLQVWHRALLSGDAPEPYGWLLCVRSPLSRTDCQSVLRQTQAPAQEGQPLYHARLTRSPDADADLVLEVGGRDLLEFMVKTATSK